MGFLNRIFGKASRTQVQLARTGQGGAVWPERRYDVYAKETYLKQVVAYRCICMIARAVGAVPWAVVRTDDEGKNPQPLPKHPLTTVFKRPNPTEGLPAIMEALTSFLVMAGNAFLERMAPDTGPNRGIPREFWVLRPDRMKVIVDDKTGALMAYEYSVGGEAPTRFEVDPVTLQADLLHLKNFHPTNDWWGASPTEATAREIDIANQSAEWNKALMDNEGRPGMVIFTEDDIGDDQLEEIEKKYAKHTGSKNAGRNLIISGSKGSAHPYALSPKELDFVEGGREMARKICLGYGVPPMLLGIPGDNTYSNYAEARLSFWEDTVTWYLDYYKGEFTNWLIRPNEANVEVDYSLENIPALGPKRTAQWDRAEKANFLTINEKRELAGYDKVPDGDGILVPATLIPLGTEIDEGEESEGNEDDEEESGE